MAHPESDPETEAPRDYQLVSVHGGHSGGYCGHARDALADVVARYVELGFDWFCLTEHIPPDTKALRMPEEAAADLSVTALNERFDAYFAEARALAHQYRDRCEIYVGFETEAFTGYTALLDRLIDRHCPDMLVGSVHHLHDILFDAGPDAYARAVAGSGSIERFYCDYFDKQLELIEAYRPAVIGHFDLVRIFDPDYQQRWENATIRDRALRNLTRIAELGLVLDVNTRALKKGASEPYISGPLLDFAVEQGVGLALGDDSHGVADVGAYLDEGVAILRSRGVGTDWTRPRIDRPT